VLLEKEYALEGHVEAQADVMVARVSLGDLAAESLDITTSAGRMADQATDIMHDAAIAMSSTKQMLTSMETAIMDSVTNNVVLEHDKSFMENHRTAFNHLSTVRRNLTTLRSNIQQLKSQMRIHIENTRKSQSTVNKLAGEQQPVAMKLRELEHESPWNIASYAKASSTAVLCSFGGLLAGGPVGAVAGFAVCTGGSVLKHSHDVRTHTIQKNDLKVVVNDARDMLPVLHRYERRLDQVASGIGRFESHVRRLSTYVGSASSSLTIRRYTLPLLKETIVAVDKATESIVDSSERLSENRQLMNERISD